MERRIVTGVLPRDMSERRVAAEVAALLAAGVKLKPAGAAKRRPSMLFAAGYAPRYRIDLFDTVYYLSNLRVDRNFRFFVAYVRLATKPREIYPRIFYKDSSLIWRSPSHYIRSATENWIGKGDLKLVVENVNAAAAIDEADGEWAKRMFIECGPRGRTGGLGRPIHDGELTTGPGEDIPAQT